MLGMLGMLAPSAPAEFALEGSLSLCSTLGQSAPGCSIVVAVTASRSSKVKSGAGIKHAFLKAQSSRSYDQNVLPCGTSAEAV